MERFINITTSNLSLVVCHLSLNEGVIFLLIKLEQELTKVSGLKETLKEMGASLWQGRPRKKIPRAWASDARKRILGWYKKSRRCY